jgi:ACGX-repeat protein
MEVKKMRKLRMFDAWVNDVSKFFPAKSAQSYLQPAMAVAGFCGAGDEKKEERPSACGSSCGADDAKKEKKPSACGSSCGADEDKKEEKPSACGAGAK